MVITAGIISAMTIPIISIISKLKTDIAILSMGINPTIIATKQTKQPNKAH